MRPAALEERARRDRRAGERDCSQGQAGVPRKPRPTAPTARTISGTVITAGLSWACAAAGERGSPQKTSQSSRVM
jgi:hypothetical protein